MIEEINWSKSANTQKQSSAHVDAGRNYTYAKDLINRQAKLLKDIQVVYDGINKDFEGNFETNVHVSFYWKQRNTNFGHAISFHQPEKEFKAQLHKFLRIPQLHVPPIQQKRTEWLDSDLFA